MAPLIKTALMYPPLQLKIHVINNICEEAGINDFEITIIRWFNHKPLA